MTQQAVTMYDGWVFPGKGFPTGSDAAALMSGLVRLWSFVYHAARSAEHGMTRAPRYFVRSPMVGREG